MVDIKVALGHHLFQIPETEPEPEIPTDAEHDDFGFEMSPFEQRRSVASHASQGTRPAPIWFATLPVTKLKQFIANKYLVKLSGYGSVVLRSEKEAFEAAVKALEKYIKRFQRQVKKKLQAAIDNNRRVLTAALLPSVEANPPVRWRKFLGPSPDSGQMARMLDHELKDAFGSVDHLIADMKVQKVFKGVTYESLCDQAFRRVALKAIPSLAELHEEYDAAKATDRPA